MIWSCPRHMIFRKSLFSEILPVLLWTSILLSTVLQVIYNRLCILRAQHWLQKLEMIQTEVHQKMIFFNLSCGRGQCAIGIYLYNECHTKHFNNVSPKCIIWACFALATASVQNCMDQFWLLDDVNNLKEQFQKNSTDMSQDKGSKMHPRYKFCMYQCSEKDKQHWLGSSHKGYYKRRYRSKTANDKNIWHRNKTAFSELNPVQSCRSKSMTCLRKGSLNWSDQIPIEQHSCFISDGGAQNLGNSVRCDSESIATKVCSQIGSKWNAIFESHAVTSLERTSFNFFFWIF